jgi:hypothetical protein
VTDERVNCFFIVGAPRCGTTAMSKYLKAHPSICFSSPKETNFFLSVNAKASPAQLKEQFLKSFFEPSGKAVQIYGEGSVSTLYSREALGRILECFPDAKFIVMLRNPVEQLPSYHARLLYYRQENVADFASAWDLQDARLAGKNIPQACFDPRLLQYRDVGSLGRYTSQLFEIAGRERCLPILHDDLTADTAGIYRQVLRFLDLCDDGRTDFRRKNQQRQFKSAFWHEFYTGAFLGPAGRLLARHPHHLAMLSRMTRRLRKGLKRGNATEVTLPPLDPAMAARLRSSFAEDIGLLGLLLQRDLSHWLAESSMEHEATDVKAAAATAEA